MGLKFYDKDGAVVLQTGLDWVANEYCKTHTMPLEEGERVIGYKSRGIPAYPREAFHFDF